MMKRLTLPLSAALLLLACSGCLFHRKSAAKAPADPKPSPYISSEVKAQFEERWVEKRTGDLVAQGVAPDAAKAQAEAEYKQRFVYAQPAPPKH
jgi:hypothetical protein